MKDAFCIEATNVIGDGMTESHEAPEEPKPFRLELIDPAKGLQEVLLVHEETSPFVTPERLAELHEQGRLACPPIVIEGHGTLCIPKPPLTAGNLVRLLTDTGHPMEFYA